nr:malectin-like isoform X2 [Pelodiscus sinensis]XP_025044828.1 malectin-like isoform X3 [Pelodiscus sinensis]|eukprot:XP_025044827.1 malectin-like isoform X2 [Pelodiscus sinensis]
MQFSTLLHIEPCGNGRLPSGLFPYCSPASDYGVKLPILRSNTEDQILYQTERYNEETFGYEVPIKEEGDYVVVLKFAEVYFAQSQQKVFDVRLNGHVVVKDLDIFDRVGHSTAHDEMIPISIRKGKLSVQGEVSTFTGKLHIEFVKGYYDNPKICALYILQGTVDGKFLTSNPSRL